jgi:hypothetical protein
MSTFDVRHPTGDLLVHLHDVSFNPKLRQLLDEVVPRLPHDEISESRVTHLRRHSADFPNIHMPHHEFGPICLEVLQPTQHLSQDTWNVLLELAGALVAEHG